MYVLKINVGCISTWDKFVDCNYEKNIYKYSIEYDYAKICICSLHKHYWQISCVMLNFAGSIKNANLEKVAWSVYIYLRWGVETELKTDKI